MVASYQQRPKEIPPGDRVKDFVGASEMSAAKYCRRWVPIHHGYEPGQRGFKKRCYEEMAAIVGVTPDTVKNNWGEHFQDTPEYALRILRLADLTYRLAGEKPWESLTEQRQTSPF